MTNRILLLGLMYKHAAKRGLNFLLVVSLLLPCLVAVAAAPVHTVKVDLRPLIRAAFESPVQFAVLVPHAASTATAGTWSTANGRATWRYAVRVPTAVSLSFHATSSALPDSATLIVRGTRTAVSYHARDLRKGELWSRIQPGEALEFELTVAGADRSRVALNIVSLQAGYRAIGPGVQDHPYYRALVAKAQAEAATGNAACVTNYECEVTSANTPPGAATVALVIGNQYQCTGTLLNDVPQDNTPYVLTARHCQTGKLGGGNPGAAATTTAYWDATTPCDSALGSIYDPNVPAQTGAQTLVEQQDAWLILLDVNPVVSDAQFAGFDATGGSVQGGYTIQNAEGGDKQYTGWSGTAAAVRENDILGSSYLSNFWETVNSIGNTGPGASGSGLFNQYNRLVGSMTLGRSTGDPSGYGMCPATPPPAPNGTNGAADFTALAAVWRSTADTSSTTGATTLQSVLDPDNTGTLTTPSAAVEAIELSAFTDSLSYGQSLQLSWSVPAALQCTATGGVAGDGWSGTVATTGTESVTEFAAGSVTYGLTCTYAAGRSAHTAVTVTWLGVVPIVQLSGPAAVWAGTPATLTWTSNVTPCAISGGGLALSNLAASGTTTDTQATPADVTYTLTCGTGAQSASNVVVVSYVTPSLVLVANGTDRLIGQTFFLQWMTYANSCIPSGGAPNDGWDSNSFTGASAQSQEPFYLTVTTPGTYTYTLTCSTATLSQQQSVTVTFENNAPYVTDTLSSSSVTFSASPADYVTLSWNSNLSSCGFTSTPSIPDTIGMNSAFPQGELTLTPSQSGTYQLSVYCFALNSTTPTATATTLTLTVLPPPPPTVTISFTPSSVVAGQSFQAAWTATNATGCTLSGGIAGGTWGGSAQAVAITGSDAEVAQTAGQYTFSATCTSIDSNTPATVAQATLTVIALNATLSATSTTVSSGGSFTLSWTSGGATSCTASGGGANGTPWSGTLATSGTATQTASVAGTFTYTLTCTGGGQTTQPQNVTIQVTPMVSTVSSSAPSASKSSGGGGGGGGVGLLDVLLLTALACRRRGPWRVRS
jgi:lysyl endopeptidase